MRVLAGDSVFIFHCQNDAGAKAVIKVSAVHATQVGEVSFSCDDDAFALTLLTQCRSDSGGYFNLLAGCKPLYVEQWLEYLQENGQLKSLKVTTLAPLQEGYEQAIDIDDEARQTLLNHLYKVGGFNKLQVARYMKQRNNLAYLSTKYSKDDLQRYLQLGEAIRFVRQLKP
ncbi:hypothetical protein [Motilimonas pumila]|uniref:hypothetical protein n=1 Tax=Motilimonas pumila TaxID=2303987 RepID=UPI001E5B2E72|nr:hypothetical protein [Motilimonas pumila]